jgi:hypothetical protein
MTNGDSKEIDPLALPYVALSETRYLPTCAGIYFAIEEGGAVGYIGQSLNIRLRWRSHPIAADLCAPADLAMARRIRLAWLAVEDPQQLDQLQRAFIRRFRPRLNQTHNGEPKPVEKPKTYRSYTPTAWKLGDRPKILTAKQFAVETGISYPVIIEWLKEGKIPEAEQTSFKIWQIPATVAEMFKKPENRPKLGRHRQDARRRPRL